MTNGLNYVQVRVDLTSWPCLVKGRPCTFLRRKGLKIEMRWPCLVIRYIAPHHIRFRPVI